MRRSIYLTALFLICAAITGCASAPVPPAPRCVGACNTHTEGYEWAHRTDLQDDRVCSEYAEPFAAGCRDGVEDRNQLRRGARGI